jgi:hypothetical protein
LEGSEFESKPWQAMAMPARAFAAKVPLTWLAADEADGRSRACGCGRRLPRLHYSFSVNNPNSFRDIPAVFAETPFCTAKVARPSGVGGLPVKNSQSRFRGLPSAPWGGCPITR